MNYYELLESEPPATAQEATKAYERIRKIYDPNSIALYSLFSPEETEKDPPADRRRLPHARLRREPAGV